MKHTTSIRSALCGTALLVIALAAATTLTLEGCASPARQKAGAGGVPQSPSDERLLALLQEDLDALRRSNPLWASTEGDRRFDDRLPDVSSTARSAWLADARARLDKLDRIDLNELTPANRVNAALLKYELEERLARARFESWQVPVTQQNGPQIELPQMPDTLSFTSEKQLRDYLTRLEAIPRYLAQVEENMREGLKSGRTPPRIVMLTVPEQALSQGDMKYEASPQDHLLYEPFADAEPRLAAKAREVISEDVVPAFREFGVFLRDDYVPGCRTSIAAADWPDGEAYYAFLIKHFTTLDLTADEIHRTGLAEVRRIRAEMFDVIARSDFAQKDSLSGDELFRAFAEYLRTDSRFYYDTPEGLLDGYRAIAKEVDAEMPRFFATLPRLSYGVREMPAFFAPAAPTAYYYNGSIENGVAGFFVANTYKLESRPKYEMIALTMHEAVPGHHHQIALAQELKLEGMPEWRSSVGYTAFVEGWALYSERLGLEMGEGERGFYSDPYDDFGRLSYEMWRAMRLVVDTGMHALGWSREQAIQFMVDNSALTKENIEREVDRYIAWPGQALAYKIGELHIRELRATAEKELGDRFDIRGFHDSLLLQGAVPLDVLTDQVNDWVEQTKRARR